MPDYTWKIEQCRVAPSDNGLTNVIKTLYWRCFAVDGEEQATSYGSVSLNSPNPEDFTLYEELAETTVIDWLHAALNAETEGRVTQIENDLAKAIEVKRNPPVVTVVPPWA